MVLLLVGSTMENNQTLADNLKLNMYLHMTLKKIRAKQAKPQRKGTYSYCYMFKDHVVLKNTSSIRDLDDEKRAGLEQRFKQKQAFTDYLVDELAVNTPRLVGCYTGKQHFYEIQERAKGQVLSIHYPTTARAITFNKDVVDIDEGDANLAQERERENNIGLGERDAIAKGVAKYNIAMQKMLKDADQLLFNKFVRDFKVLVQNNVGVDYFRSENFLFDKDEGFSFVDLAPRLEPAAQVEVSDFEISKMIFGAFADFKTYLNIMDAKTAKIISENMAPINEKLYNAMKIMDFKFTPNEEAQIVELTRRHRNTLKK